MMVIMCALAFLHVFYGCAIYCNNNVTGVFFVILTEASLTFVGLCRCTLERCEQQAEATLLYSQQTQPRLQFSTSTI